MNVLETEPYFEVNIPLTDEGTGNMCVRGQRSAVHSR